MEMLIFIGVVLGACLVIKAVIGSGGDHQQERELESDSELPCPIAHIENIKSALYITNDAGLRED